MSDVIDLQYNVGKHGFVRVVDVMGGDHSVVQAARVSYGKGTKSVSEDRGLIRYLMRHHHTTPFEMASIKFMIKCPMDVWRQWIRHRTASVNEYSTRYSIAIDEMATTDPSAWRYQSKTNKQGSSQEYLDVNEGRHLSDEEAYFQNEALNIYKERIDAGVAREQARKDLPLSTYTVAYWKMDLHNLLHFLRLRLDSHAQKEIREFAEVIATIVEKWVPESWAAFNDYRMNSMSLTSPEIKILSHYAEYGPAGLDTLIENLGLIEYRKDGTVKSNREREEAKVKFAKLNMDALERFLDV